MGFGVADGQRQKFTQKERDIETGLDYFGARYYTSLQGRFISVDPLEPALGKQGAEDKTAAERQFRAYLGQPQHWNRYAYALNNPLRFVDPDGFDPIVVNLNIIFEKGEYTKEQKEAFINSYVAQAKQDLGRMEIEFNVTTTEGTASNTSNHDTHQITSGTAGGAINVFVSPGSVGPSPEVSNYGKGEIWISTGGRDNTQNIGNLTHGIIHVLGIAGGVNGYDPVDNRGSDRWALIASEIWTRITGNSAESATQSLQDHLRHASECNCKCDYPHSAWKDEYRILREGARRYLKK